jgi:ABC-type phosphate transport system permease subunit
LVAVRRRLHLRQQDRRAASEFNDQYKAGAYHCRRPVLFVLTFVVNSLARAAVSGRDGHDLRSGSVRSRRPTFDGLSLRRKVTDKTATVLVTLSVVVALLPLVWVLYSVITKGIEVVTPALGGSTPRPV